MADNLRLFLYSDQLEPDTDAITDRIFSKLPRKGARIGYLPASPDPEREWFQDRQHFYARFGAKLEFFGVESEFDPTRNSELIRCDAIHLTGGNTFQFLYWLRERSMIQMLRQYAQSGGTLIGVSAGAIMMTSDTSTSYLCWDSPYRDLEGYEGLNLVPFAFLPHFEPSDQGIESLKNYSLRFRGNVYAITDAGAIVVENGETDLIGPIWRANNGAILDKP